MEKRRKYPWLYAVQSIIQLKLNWLEAIEISRRRKCGCKLKCRQPNAKLPVVRCVIIQYYCKYVIPDFQLDIYKWMKRSSSSKTINEFVTLKKCFDCSWACWLHSCVLALHRPHRISCVYSQFGCVCTWMAGGANKISGFRH